VGLLIGLGDDLAELAFLLLLHWLVVVGVVDLGETRAHLLGATRQLQW